ncbi:MAG: S49 family peptidase [Burkholderiaceae bacterium]|jgi:protease-4|nr:S49 family peptidase [Burkholderiaceae bacterium]
MEIEANKTLAGVPWERAVIEKLLLAQVREQRAARRWGLLRKLLLLALLGVVVLALFSGRLAGGPARGAHTAVVEIKGEIAKGADASAEFVLPALREAMEDKDAKALVLLINSPGGSPVQAGIINDEIARLRKKYDKPVYAVVEDTCASGAYYIAAAADKIYVDKASLVGSIGVLMNGFGFVDTLDKLGVERRLLIAGQNKGFLDPFSPMTAEQKRFAQAMLDQIHRQFIDVVKKGRGERLKEMPEIFSGLFWTGEQAIDLGLADAYGSLGSVARDVVKAEKVVDYTNKANAIDRLAKRLGVALGQGAVGALREMPQMR